MMIGYKLPVYAKASLVFIGFFALVYMLSVAKTILVPLVFSMVIAIVLSPIVNFFVRKKINRVVAITVTFLFFTILSVVAVLLVSKQLFQFSDSLPKLIESYHQLLDKSVVWFSDYFNMNPEKLTIWVDQKNKEMIKGTGSLVGSTLMQSGNFFIDLFLVPVYIFLFLYYQPRLLEFIRKLFDADKNKKVNDIITGTKKVIQSYLVGLMLEALIVTTMNSTALLIIGIDYAILLGVIGAMLNLIPYIGGIIAVSLPMVIALSTQPPIYALFVLISYLFIQFVDNNFIIPKIVASKVQINALVSVIAVIAGGALWGISGMFLSIPITAILKVIFDNIESLKPWGNLLGDIVPVTPKTIHFRRKPGNTSK